MFSFKKITLFRRIGAGRFTGRSQSEREQALESGLFASDSSKNPSMGSVHYSVTGRNVSGLPESCHESNSGNGAMSKISGKSSSDPNLIERRHYSKQSSKFKTRSVSVDDSYLTSSENGFETTRKKTV